MKSLPNIKLYLIKRPEKNKELSNCQNSNIEHKEEVWRIKESKELGEQTEADSSSDT
jgi:hypothetical protein